MGISAKNLLLLINFILGVAAFILIGFGIFILVGSSNNAVDVGENFAGGLVIAIGIVLLSLTIFGCLAAIHESHKRLTIYLISVVVLLLVQLIMIGTTSQGSKDGIAGGLVEGFDSLWHIELEKGNGLAYYEHWLHCCGVNGTDDYTHIQHTIPKSCCVEKNCIKSSALYSAGCLNQFIDYLSVKIIIFTVLNWILVIMEAVAAALAWFLIQELKNRRSRFNFN